MTMMGMGRMAAPPGRSGFTFMELLVVVVIVGMLALAVTPMFQGSLDSMRGDRVMRSFHAMVRHAGELAIIEEVEHRLVIDTETHTFWLERKNVNPEPEEEEEDAPVGWLNRSNRLPDETDGESPDFVRIPGREGQKEELPDSLRFADVKARRGDEGRYYIGFYPGGACDFATIHFVEEGRARKTLDIEGTIAKITIEAADR